MGSTGPLFCFRYSREVDPNLIRGGSLVKGDMMALSHRADCLTCGRATRGYLVVKDAGDKWFVCAVCDEATELTADS